MTALSWLHFYGNALRRGPGLHYAVKSSCAVYTLFSGPSPLLASRLQPPRFPLPPTTLLKPSDCPAVCSPIVWA